MIAAKGYAASSPGDLLKLWHFSRRDIQPHDVQIEILYCGVCHTDLHELRNDWGGSLYPIVPGHEIIGRVKNIGEAVVKFKPGDYAGVGCIIDSCRICDNCKSGMEQYCFNGYTATYNSLEQDKKTITYGGYSDSVVVLEDYVVKIPHHFFSPEVAPLLCAGITTYSPLKHWKISNGKKLGVIGLGGLGHMAVKFGVSFGAEVTVFSTTLDKEKDAIALGASNFIYSKEYNNLNSFTNYFDFIIDTVSAKHDLNPYIKLLSLDGTIVCVGLPAEKFEISVFSMIRGRKNFAGSLLGGLKETQEMVDYCALNKIRPDIELIKIQEIHSAFERMERGDVKYRFVIDMASLH